MNFSKTTEYALRIMSFMAVDEKRLYSSNEIFQHLNIPFRYLRKQLIVLSKSGLINSVQGKDGGYRISRKLSEISLLDIVSATGYNSIPNKCFFGFHNCAFEKKCAMHDKWAEIQENINSVLTSTTLEEVKEAGANSYISNNS